MPSKNRTWAEQSRYPFGEDELPELMRKAAKKIPPEKRAKLKEMGLNILANFAPLTPGLSDRYFEQRGMSPESRKEFQEEHPGMVNPRMYQGAVEGAMDLVAPGAFGMTRALKGKKVYHGYRKQKKWTSESSPSGGVVREAPETFPHFEQNLESSGAGGDLYGKGIYLTEEPRIAKGYAGVGTESTYFDPVVRTQNIPPQAKILDGDNIGVEEFDELVDAMINKSGTAASFKDDLAEIERIERDVRGIYQQQMKLAQEGTLTAQQQSNMHFARESLGNQRLKLREKIKQSKAKPWHGITDDPRIVEKIAKVRQRFTSPGSTDRYPVRAVLAKLGSIVQSAGREVRPQEMFDLIKHAGYDGLSYKAGQVTGLPRGVSKDTKNYVIYNYDIINKPRKLME